MWHFSSNEECPSNNMLYKIQVLIDMYLSKYQVTVSSGKPACIDETTVLFLGQLLTKKYVPLIAHKYGIKVFKLCTDRSFTWNLSIYNGKKADA
jgi:hypothetical protein